jgi:hypothetical protein
MSLEKPQKLFRAGVRVHRSHSFHTGKTLPESAENFRAWNLSFRLNFPKNGLSLRRREWKFNSSLRIHWGSRISVAVWCLPDGKEALLHANRAAFILVFASNGLGEGKDGSGQVQPEVLHRGRGIAAYRNLPRPFARPGTQQASRQTCPGSRSRRSRSREVAIHQFRSDDPHRFASTLPALIFPPRKPLTPVSSMVQICISMQR